MSTLGRLQARNLITVHARNHRAVEERKEKLLHSERESTVLVDRETTFTGIYCGAWRVIAQAVTRPFPIAAARVRSHWGRFSASTSVSPANHCIDCVTHQGGGGGTIVPDVPSGFSLAPPKGKIIVWNMRAVHADVDLL
jgi:hypothetical protein